VSVRLIAAARSFDRRTIPRKRAFVSVRSPFARLTRRILRSSITRRKSIVERTWPKMRRSGGKKTKLSNFEPM
jgi:hypothetical protein